MEAPIYTLRRYHLLLLLCIGTIISMMLRHATTFAVIAMGNISPIDMAQIESAYFYGYCIGTAPMGFVADAIGARFLITAAIGGSSFFALFTEVAARNGLASFIVSVAQNVRTPIFNKNNGRSRVCVRAKCAVGVH